MLEGSVFVYVCVCVCVCVCVYIYIYMIYQKISVKCIYGFSIFCYYKKICILNFTLIPLRFRRAPPQLKHRIAVYTFLFPVDTSSCPVLLGFESQNLSLRDYFFNYMATKFHYWEITRIVLSRILLLYSQSV
jgi:hypothetical protein